MRRGKREGFTLVELLVVITIIGMLVGLLMPAVNMAREAGRRAQCMNNQHQLGTAMFNFETAHKYFPGYINRLQKDTSAAARAPIVSWLACILPLLERNDLYDIWKTTTTADATSTLRNPNAPAFAYLPVAVCPSYPAISVEPGATWLSYRVNTGRRFDNVTLPAAGNVFDQRTEGVCFDLYSTVTVGGQPTGPKVGTDYLSANDGSSNTVLIGERASARMKNLSIMTTLTTAIGTSPASLTAWADGGATVTTSSATAYYASMTPFNLGFNWNGLVDTNDAMHGYVNFGVDVGDKITSQHGNISVVTFCDNHSRTISDDIAPYVFAQLMTPAYRSITDTDISPTPNTSVLSPLDDAEVH